jgi:hypothetical protein
MGKRQLLFVTYFNENLEDGVSYVIELAKATYEDIMLLFVQKRNRITSGFENLMTAVSFAEAGEHDTARQILGEGSPGIQKIYEEELHAIVKKCLREGIQAKVYSTELDMISGIRKFIKEHEGIDKVVLSPAIIQAGNLSSKDLNRLVRTTSRPVVTMTRQACAVA